MKKELSANAQCMQQTSILQSKIYTYIYIVYRENSDIQNIQKHKCMIGMVRAQRLVENPQIYCVLGLPKDGSLTHGLVETTKVFGGSPPQSSVEIVIVKIGDIRPWGGGNSKYFLLLKIFKPPIYKLGR